jgi:hypothetical protein
MLDLKCAQESWGTGAPGTCQWEGHAGDLGKEGRGGRQGHCRGVPVNADARPRMCSKARGTGALGTWEGEGKGGGEGRGKGEHHNVAK